MIESDNKLFGLLGKDIGYSFSRDYFLNKFRVENIQHKYVNFDLENLSTFKTFGKGWTRRVNETTELALKMK